MKTDTHTQCTLTHPKTNKTQIVWIPSEFAKEGRIIKLKEKGIWQNGWVVQNAGITLDTQYVRDNERNYKNQREASDI